MEIKTKLSERGKDMKLKIECRRNKGVKVEDVKPDVVKPKQKSTKK